MTSRQNPRIWSIPVGVPFLDHLAKTLLAGDLVPGFSFDDDPLALAGVTIYVPTRRAARALRAIFVERAGGRAALLPSIRPLGDFDEDAGFFDASESAALALAPPITVFDRIISLAPLVQAWTSRLPAHLAGRYNEPLLVPASMADAIWLARDLAELMDEVETEGVEWSALEGLVEDDLAGWWQVTVEFLKIVTATWPAVLAERDRSNPAMHRNALIDAETERLKHNPPAGPVIAAGSTGSIPATARLLSVVARLPLGAVVLPGLDMSIGSGAWSLIGDTTSDPTVFGHPQYGLKKLLETIGIERSEIGSSGRAVPALQARAEFVSQAMRPAAATDSWASDRPLLDQVLDAGALEDVTLIEASSEREEAAAIAIALRIAINQPGATAALVTGDRELARRVSTELRRFSVMADDSGGAPLAMTPPATLLRLLLEATMRPGDPLAILALLKHPLLHVGLDRQSVRGAAEWIELIALRAGTARPDIGGLSALFDRRLEQLGASRRKAFWFDRLDDSHLGHCRATLENLSEAVQPLIDLRSVGQVAMRDLVNASIAAFEACGRDEQGALGSLYKGESGTALAEFLRALLATDSGLEIETTDWPDVVAALIAGEMVKPKAGGDSRIAIWSALEARLQSVDTLVVGGLNEGSWPQGVEVGRFMSRMMKIGMNLEPPERRIGLAAHDFQMAMGAPKLVLSRSARSGDAPSVASRWVQRLLTCTGEAATKGLRSRGEVYLAWARAQDLGQDRPFADRPNPKPPVRARPRRFSVTEIETLRRDPYAVYAKRILGLRRLDPLDRDPAAAERGTLFHEILHQFVQAGVDPNRPDALDQLVGIARRCFAETGLPTDIEALWWPRFDTMAGNIIAWEARRAPDVLERYSEISAAGTDIGETGTTLSGRADRIDVVAGGSAHIIDYKTGSSPSKGQAHILLSPQLALEGALLSRGAFSEPGARAPSDLVYVRLRPDGTVAEESILKHNHQVRTAADLCDEAWSRLSGLLTYFAAPDAGYLSRALPFRAEDTDGDYDHLARVLEWSAGGESEEAGGE